MGEILIVEDEVVLARTIVSFLERRGFSASYAVDAASGKVLFERNKPRLVILDYKLERDDGLQLLEWMRQRNPEAQVAMMTGHGEVDIAVRAMKAGARDFLVKPAPLEAIAAMARDLMLDEMTGQDTRTGADRIAGRSSVATELRTEIRKLAATASSRPPPAVLVSGPAGAGKGLVGRALHETARGPDAPFAELDCRLGGHDQPALLAEALDKAGDGTLLLRHVDELQDEAQARLLRHMADTEAAEGQTWIIATTTRNLAQLHREGRFREDLLYRVQVGWIEVLPLCERPADILPIAESIARRAALRYNLPRPRFAPEARARLIEHGWPGNVREMGNCIERAMLNATANLIEAGDIRLIGLGGAPDTAVPNLRRMEEQALETALEAAGGNVSRAARLLGISRDTLRYRMEKFGLSRQ